MLKSPRMYISRLFVSTLDKFSLKISIKFVCLGGQQILPISIGLLFYINNSSLSLGKYDLIL